MTYKILKKITSFFLLLIFIVYLGSCDQVLDVKNICPENSDYNSLFVLTDGNNGGIWVLDADSLIRIDTMTTHPRAPYSIEFSTDYHIWYSTWPEQLFQRGLFAINAMTKRVVKRADTKNIYLTSALCKNVLITYSDSIVQFYNVNSLALEHELNMHTATRVVTAPNQKEIYIFTYKNMMIYDVEKFEYSRSLQCLDSSFFSYRISISDVEFSPNGKYLYLTLFYPVDGGNFYVIDVEKDSVIDRYGCGTGSQIGISPDGNYVYISDPAGRYLESEPTNKMWRYDVRNQEMQVFIEGLQEIGLRGGLLITDNVVVAGDNKSIFIVLLGAAQTSDGKSVHLIKLDLETRKILSTYSLPRDERGYITELIRYVKLGKYLIQ
jgi:WD40 repeat protein